MVTLRVALNRPLRSTGAGVPQHAILGEDSGLQERFHQGQDTFISDPLPHPIHKGRMRNLVEAGFDVSLHDPFIRAGREMVNLGHCVMSPAPRAEPVGAREEIRLEDRLQHQLQGRLDHPVGYGRDPQAALLAVRLRDHALPHRHRTETTGLQLLPQPVTEHLDPELGLDRIRGLAVVPAERAPLLPRTRSHATITNAGSQTRLYRSSNLRWGSSLAQRCSLAWISRTRRPAENSPDPGSPVFTGGLRAFPSPAARLAGPGPQAFPASTAGRYSRDYYGASAPPMAIS